MIDGICLEKYDTIVHADTVEFSPNTEVCHLLCGTYQLDEEKQERFGKLFLFNWEDDVRSLLWSQHMAGILDCVWCSPSSFTLALADGKVTRYIIDNEADQKLPDVKLSSTTVVYSQGLILSIDSKSNRWVCSDSGGQVTLLEGSNSGSNSGELCITSQWKAHDFEAWVACLSPHRKEMVISGGDDCRLCVWDSRTQPELGTPVSAKKHDMGVCSIQCHPFDENILSSGCYDGCVRVWDLRSFRQPIGVCDVGGGVWRHKWCPITGRHVLVAGMHAGFSVVHFPPSASGDEEHWRCGEGVITCRYDRDHSSLAYGVDWKPGEKGSDYQVASCSFYDHLLTFWTLPFTP